MRPTHELQDREIRNIRAINQLSVYAARFPETPEIDPMGHREFLLILDGIQKASPDHFYLLLVHLYSIYKNRSNLTPIDTKKLFSFLNRRQVFSLNHSYATLGLLSVLSQHKHLSRPPSLREIVLILPVFIEPFICDSRALSTLGALLSILTGLVTSLKEFQNDHASHYLHPFLRDIVTQVTLTEPIKPSTLCYFLRQLSYSAYIGLLCHGSTAIESKVKKMIQLCLSPDSRDSSAELSNTERSTLKLTSVFFNQYEIAKSIPLPEQANEVSQKEKQLLNTISRFYLFRDFLGPHLTIEYEYLEPTLGIVTDACITYTDTHSKTQKLILQIDGPSHSKPQNAGSDAMIDGLLKKLGYSIIRVDLSVYKSNRNQCGEYMLWLYTAALGTPRFTKYYQDIHTQLRLEKPYDYKTNPWPFEADDKPKLRHETLAQWSQACARERLEEFHQDHFPRFHTTSPFRDHATDSPLYNEALLSTTFLHR